MQYTPPTLKLKYMKPAYLELTYKRFKTLREDQENAEAFPAASAIIGIVVAAGPSVRTGERIGAISGEIYVDRFGLPVSI